MGHFLRRVRPDNGEIAGLNTMELYTLILRTIELKIVEVFCNIPKGSNSLGHILRAKV